MPLMLRTRARPGGCSRAARERDKARREWPRAPAPPCVAALPRVGAPRNVPTARHTIEGHCRPAALRRGRQRRTVAKTFGSKARCAGKHSSSVCCVRARVACDASAPTGRHVQSFGARVPASRVQSPSEAFARLSPALPLAEAPVRAPRTPWRRRTWRGTRAGTPQARHLQPPPRKPARRAWRAGGRKTGITFAIFYFVGEAGYR